MIFLPCSVCSGTPPGPPSTHIAPSITEFLTSWPPDRHPAGTGLACSQMGHSACVGPPQGSTCGPALCFVCMPHTHPVCLHHGGFGMWLSAMCKAGSQTPLSLAALTSPSHPCLHHNQHQHMWPPHVCPMTVISSYMAVLCDQVAIHVSSLCDQVSLLCYQVCILHDR